MITKSKQLYNLLGVVENVFPYCNAIGCGGMCTNRHSLVVCLRREAIAYHRPKCHVSSLFCLVYLTLSPFHDATCQHSKKKASHCPGVFFFRGYHPQNEGRGRSPDCRIQTWWPPTFLTIVVSGRDRTCIVLTCPIVEHNRVRELTGAGADLRHRFKVRIEKNNMSRGALLFNFSP